MSLSSKIKRIIQEEKLIDPDDRVLLGLSGGIDSTTLLFVLKECARELGFEIGLAHVNHMLRGEESERDEAFVRRLGEQLSLACYVRRVNVKDEARLTGKSLQHAGRDIRYRFFTEIAEGDRFTKIAVAHNLDDQIETFLLRGIKGTGMKGLSSIPIRRDMSIRPLLKPPRRDIEAYARGHEMPFVEDSSNAKSVYERNFIRREILPLMERINPAVRQRIFSLLQDMTAINEIFDQKAETFLREEVQREGGDVSIPLEALKGLDEETGYRVLSKALQTLAPSFIPLREHIRLVKKVAGGVRPSGFAVLPYGVRVRRVYGDIIATTKKVEVRASDTYPVKTGENRIDPLNVTLHIGVVEVMESGLAGGGSVAFLDQDKLGELSVRTFVDGDRFVPLGMSAFTKLKDFFIARKVPREARRRIPILLSGKDIVWIVGHRIDERFKIEKETRHVLKVAATMSPGCC